MLLNYISFLLHSCKEFSRVCVSLFLFLQVNTNFVASKQMLYGVYGNVINIMEEFEKRESRTALPGSKICGPDQSRKGNDDKRIHILALVFFE